MLFVQCPCTAGKGQMLALVLLYALCDKGVCPAWSLPSNGIIIHLSCLATWEPVHDVVGGATAALGDKLGRREERLENF